MKGLSPLISSCDSCKPVQSSPLTRRADRPCLGLGGIRPIITGRESWVELLWGSRPVRGLMRKPEPLVWDCWPPPPLLFCPLWCHAGEVKGRGGERESEVIMTLIISVQVSPATTANGPHTSRPHWWTEDCGGREREGGGQVSTAFSFIRVEENLRWTCADVQMESEASARHCSTLLLNGVRWLGNLVVF